MPSSNHDTIRQAYVFDTNILLAWYVWNDPRLAAVLKPVLEGERLCYRTGATLAEFNHELRRSKLNPSQQDAAMHDWLRLSHDAPEAVYREIAQASISPPCRCRDPDDQKFVELAWALRPSVLWTRDKALLKLSRKLSIHDVQVVNDLAHDRGRLQ